jgi:serine/threonine-protein kinase
MNRFRDAPRAGQQGRLHDLIDGRFQPLRELGRGGVTRVDLAEDKTTGKQVAVKRLNETISDIERARITLKVEAAALSTVSRDGVPRLIHHLDHPENPYLALEYVRGMPFNINNIIEDRHRLVLLHAINLCAILSTLHDAGIVHRDVKPSNIILSNDKRSVTLLDYGFALVPGMPDLGSDRVVGTHDFMAPEQSYPGYTVDRRADIYSLAVMAYSFYSGHYPFVFRADTKESIIDAHRFQAPAPLTEVCVGAPPRLSLAFSRALEKEPHRRYSDAEEFADALSDCLAL